MKQDRGLWRQMLAILACVTLLTGSIVGTAIAQDEPAPTADPADILDPTLPQENTPAADDAEEPEETPAPEQPASTPQSEPRSNSSGAQRVDPATTPGAPATIAHGLAYYDGDDLVWQVQEIEVPVIAEADSFTSESAIIVQREGQSIIRNNATGKRALLTPGSAFFITTDDSYTLMAEDDGSMVWKFSLVDPDDVASDAFYESPVVTTVRENTYDFRMTRYVLQPGDTADLPSNNGAGLVMPGAGEVQVDHGGQASLLGLDGSHGQGQMLRQPTSISNSGNEPTVVFYLYLGDTVSDDSAGAPQGSGNAVDSGNTSSVVTPASTGDSSGDASTDTGSSEGETSPDDQVEGGPYLAQINIYAETEIYLQVTVDGVLWFDGTLPAGSWSGAMSGSTFEVYTSSGSSTLFENACGVQFFMGEEPGEAYYTLVADANSCPPAG